MSSTAAKTDPVLWEKVKSEVTGEGKGGKPGQWSARKAQLATLIYKREGGGYEGQKSQDNHLTEWTHEEWGTKSGAESGRTGERYLPKQARKSLSDSEYQRTTAKKRADTKKGAQFSSQPADIAAKTANMRHHGSAHDDKTTTLKQLRSAATRLGIRGRSWMKKAELQQAVEKAT